MVPPVYWLRSKLLLVEGGLGGRGLLRHRAAGAMVVLVGVAMLLIAVGGSLALRLVPHNPRYDESGLCQYLQ